MKTYTELHGHALSFLPAHLAFVDFVNFVSDEDARSRLAGVLVDAVHPVGHVLEGGVISYVKADDHSVSFAVE